MRSAPTGKKMNSASNPSLARNLYWFLKIRCQPQVTTIEINISFVEDRQNEINLQTEQEAKNNLVG